MAKQTERDKTIAGLRAIGYTLDENARTSKYLVFRKPDYSTYLVGKNGALRRTRTSVSASTSSTGSRFHRMLRIVGERAESYSSVEQAREDFRSMLYTK